MNNFFVAAIAATQSSPPIEGFENYETTEAPANPIHSAIVSQKRFYNTELGKGTVDKAFPHFVLACSP
jgi:hypothetical protein